MKIFPPDCNPVRKVRACLMPVHGEGVALDLPRPPEERLRRICPLQSPFREWVEAWAWDPLRPSLAALLRPSPCSLFP
jgi:hypothetical protein